MRLLADQDQRDLAAMCRGLLGELHSPGSDRITPTLWKALAQAGVLGLAIGDEFGGSGGALTDLGVFCVEAGRALCPMVVHSTLQAALAVDWLGGPAARAAWLPAH